MWETSTILVLTCVYREMILWKRGLSGLVTADWHTTIASTKSQSTFCCVKHMLACSVTWKSSDWDVRRCRLFWVGFLRQATVRGYFLISSETVVGEKALGNTDYHSFSLSLAHTHYFYTFLQSPLGCSHYVDGSLSQKLLETVRKSSGKVNLSCSLCWHICPFWFLP